MLNLDKSLSNDTITRQAEVAELADALRSGRSDRKVMRVQIPPSAFSPGQAARWPFLFVALIL